MGCEMAHLLNPNTDQPPHSTSTNTPHILNTPLQLGSLTLANRVFFAPLAGCSDYPFRQMVADSAIRPGLFYCEMVKMEALVRGDPHTYHLLDYAAAMHPIGAQLCGSDPSLAGEAAMRLEDLGFDVVDLNCGCPVDKVTKDGSGSGLLRNPERIGEILHEMVQAVSIPVTVKIRIGWDDEHYVAEEVTKIAEQAGAKAICIHGRTRAQGYTGPAIWEPISACKRIAKTIHVIGNGDVMSADAAVRMVAETGCDGVMAARGTMGHPWLAEEILLFTQGLEVPPRTAEKSREALMRHFGYISAYAPERTALLDMRRVGCWYVHHQSGARAFRGMISKAQTLQDVQTILEDFSFESCECGPVKEDANETQELHFLLEGDVQGVGLRYWMCQEASKKGWKGFVSNLPSGHVELVVQGPVKQDQVLQQLVYHEQSPARIERVTATRRLVTREHGPFQIVRE